MEAIPRGIHPRLFSGYRGELWTLVNRGLLFFSTYHVSPLAWASRLGRSAAAPPGTVQAQRAQRSGPQARPERAVVRSCAQSMLGVH